MLKEEIKDSIEKWNEKACRIYDRNFPMPIIDFSLRGKTAGAAYFYGGDKTNVIKVNMTLASENREDFLFQTCGHEVAHLITRQIVARRIQPHGVEWQEVMVTMGLPPKRCHNYKVKEVPRTTYNCYCGASYALTVRQVNKYEKLINNGRKVTCSKCTFPLIIKAKSILEDM